jgi:hypothetical protein
MLPSTLSVAAAPGSLQALRQGTSSIITVTPREVMASKPLPRSVSTGGVVSAAGLYTAAAAVALVVVAVVVAARHRPPMLQACRLAHQRSLPAQRRVTTTAL